MNPNRDPNQSILPMKKSLPCLFALAAFALGTVPLSSQTTTKPAITLELAKKVAAKAHEEAARNNWSVVITIVDDGGNLVYVEKMDGTQIGSIGVSQAKARGAINFKRPTKVFENLVNGGNTGLLSLPGVVANEGGITLVVDGTHIGAIGVSGATSAQDGQVAAAGLTALAP